MKPTTFFEDYDDTDRKKFVEDFNKNFASYIDTAAKKYCVPRILLWYIILNEWIDYSPWEAWGERSGVGNSLGPAQIHINTADKYKLYDKR